MDKALRTMYEMVKERVNGREIRNTEEVLAEIKIIAEFVEKLEAQG